MRTCIARLVLTATMCGALGGKFDAGAQEYPSRTIELIAPAPAGATTDMVARTIAEILSSELGVAVVVINMPGRNGVQGATDVARADPDGYRLLVADTTPVNYAPLLHRSLAYDPMRDFTFLSILIDMPLAFAAHPSSPFDTVPEFVEAARAEPGRYSFGSGSALLQMPGEMLKIREGIDIVSIPYKGGSPSYQDAIGGHIDTVFGGIGPLTPLIEAGMLKGLAVTGVERAPSLPDVPTMIESGYENFTAGTWFGILGPRDIPGDVVQKLTAALAEVAMHEKWLALADRVGGVVTIISGDEFRKRVLMDNEQIVPAIEAAGLTAK